MTESALELARREAADTCTKCDGNPHARKESDYSYSCEPHHTAIARLEAAARLAGAIAQIDKMVKEATYNMKRRREGPLHQCGEGDVICLMNRERDRMRREVEKG